MDIVMRPAPQDDVGINSLGDDVLLNIFEALPFSSKREHAQFVCTRWYRLFACPKNRTVWGALNLRLSNRLQDSNNSLCHITIEVLESNTSFCSSEFVALRERFIRWLTLRASGFAVLNLVIDVDSSDVWENEMAACRRALWFVVTNTVIPIIGLLSSSLREVVVTVADNDDALPPSALYQANSALRCLAYTLSSLPHLEFTMMDSLALQDVSHSFFSVGVLRELKVLIIRGCSLRSLPHASNLSALEGLDLSCNPIDPEWLENCLPSLTRLDSLIVCSCSLSRLPRSITRLSRLEKLYANHNSFGRNRDWLPPGISSLSSLQTLTLQENCLQELPAQVASLQGLTALELQSNELTCLPPEMALLSRLQVLEAACNKLSTIPCFLGQLGGLSSLDLSRQATRYRLGAEGVLLDLNTTVRLEKPLDPLLRLQCLSRLRLPVVELTDCEHHSGGERDEESVARTVLFLNNFRARIVGAYAARGVVPPQIDTE